MQFEFTTHAENMLLERNIDREWVNRAISEPLMTDMREDGTTHYIKPIPEREGRMLRVIISTSSPIPRVITVFFDRRLRS